MAAARELVLSQMMFLFKGTHRWYSEFKLDSGGEYLFIKMQASSKASRNKVDTEQSWLIKRSDIDRLTVGTIRDGRQEVPVLLIHAREGTHIAQRFWREFLTENQIKYGVMPLSGKLRMAKMLGETFHIEAINEFFESMRGTTSYTTTNTAGLILTDPAIRDRVGEYLSDLLDFGRR
ncbi:MAG TPA: hypothetical protein VFV50_12750 [Bdellovibrionales bacterium]|nr:hypothetical protein [Bdellovibrionales bacterium]